MNVGMEFSLHRLLDSLFENLAYYSGRVLYEVSVRKLAGASEARTGSLKVKSKDENLTILFLNIIYVFQSYYVIIIYGSL